MSDVKASGRGLKVIGYGARVSPRGPVAHFESKRLHLEGFKHIVPLVDAREAKQAIDSAYERGSTEFSCEDCNGGGTFTITSQNGTTRHPCTCVPDDAAEIVEKANDHKAALKAATDDVAKLRGLVEELYESLDTKVIACRCAPVCSFCVEARALLAEAEEALL